MVSPDTKYKARFISSHIHKCEVRPAVGDSGAGGTQVELVVWKTVTGGSKQGISLKILIGSRFGPPLVYSTQNSK